MGIRGTAQVLGLVRLVIGGTGWLHRLVAQVGDGGTERQRHMKMMKYGA